MSEHEIRMLEERVESLEGYLADACARINAIYALLPDATTEDEVREAIYDAMFNPIEFVVSVMRIIEEDA